MSVNTPSNSEAHKGAEKFQAPAKDNEKNAKPQGTAEAKMAQQAEALRTRPDKAFEAIGEMPDIKNLSAITESGDGGDNKIDQTRVPTLELATNNGERVGRFRDEENTSSSEDTKGADRLAESLRADPSDTLDKLAKDPGRYEDPALAKNMSDKGGEPGFAQEYEEADDAKSAENNAQPEDPGDKKELSTAERINDIKDKLDQARLDFVEKNRWLSGLTRGVTHEQKQEAQNNYNKLRKEYTDLRLQKLGEDLEAHPEWNQTAEPGKKSLSQEEADALALDLTIGEEVRLTEAENKVREKRVQNGEIGAITVDTGKRLLQDYKDLRNRVTSRLASYVVSEDAGKLKKIGTQAVIGGVLTSGPLVAAAIATGGGSVIYGRIFGGAMSAEGVKSGAEAYLTAKHQIKTTEDVTSKVNEATEGGQVNWDKYKNMVNSESDKADSRFMTKKAKRFATTIAAGATATAIGMVSRTASRHAGEALHAMANSEIGQAAIKLATTDVATFNPGIRLGGSALAAEPTGGEVLPPGGGGGYGAGVEGGGAGGGVTSPPVEAGWWDTVKDQADKAWGNTKAAAQTVVEGAKHIGDTGIEDAINNSDWGKAVDKAVNTAAETIEDTAGNFENTVNDSDWGKAVDKAVNTAAGNIQTGAGKLTDAINTSDWGSSVNEGVVKAEKYLETPASAVGEDIKDAAGNFENTVNDSDWGKATNEWVQNAGNKVSEYAERGYDTVFGGKAEVSGVEDTSKSSAALGEPDKAITEMAQDSGSSIESDTVKTAGAADETPAESAAETSTEAPHTYVVREGDALERIIRHDLKASHPGLDSDLREKMIRHMLNNLPDRAVPSGNPNLIHPGERLDMIKIMGTQEQIDKMINDPDMLKTHAGDGASRLAGTERQSAEDRIAQLNKQSLEQHTASAAKPQSESVYPNDAGYTESDRKGMEDLVKKSESSIPPDEQADMSEIFDKYPPRASTPEPAQVVQASQTEPSAGTMSQEQLANLVRNAEPAQVVRAPAAETPPVNANIESNLNPTDAPTKGIRIDRDDFHPDQAQSGYQSANEIATKMGTKEPVWDYEQNEDGIVTSVNGTPVSEKFYTQQEISRLHGNETASNDDWVLQPGEKGIA